MSTTATTATSSARSTAARPTAARPSWGRRTAVACTGAFACLAPTVWFIAVVVQLATGTEADHRFHQVTGQGLLLCALWLSGLLPMIRAGWRGTAPSAVTAVQAGLMAGSGLGVGLLAPSAGGGPVGGYAVVSLALLWAALPVRPQLRGMLRRTLDPVLAPVVLLAAALVTPFVVGEIALQNAFDDEHAHMAHYFDMAWMSVALVLVGALAAVVPAARRRALWLTGGLVLTGAARIAFTPNVTWSLLALALGTVGTLVVLADRRHR